ncbi:MAG TPA: hypothetical protein VIA18_29275 [Polyangia bacterium]|jgi:phospholipase C|nr:hypothetical protein [Polyangia bacterium]
MRTNTFVCVFAFIFTGCAGDVTESPVDQPLAEIPTSSVATDSVPAGTRQPDWDAESADDETRSTHLWIVNRARDLLALRTDLPQAVNAVALLNAPDCEPSWHQGLVDADFKTPYNGAIFSVPVGAPSAELILAGATWASHFYDVDTGLNYKGQSTPTAFDQALAHLGNARAKWAANDRADGCYELGLSLHYMTDITQPMHASNYTASDFPVKLHSDFESYAETLQANYVVTSWSGPTAGDPTAQLLAAAHASKALWPPLRAAVAASYDATCADFNLYWIDHTSCWTGSSAVAAQLGTELASAQLSTASYLYSLALP